MIIVKRRVVEVLMNKYVGETAWIVGKGPSLRDLRAEHFGDGPVITMNESILIVQDLGLSNPLYSMQKDGCSPLREVERCGGMCQMKFPMVYPNPDVTVILQDPGFSENCLPKHERRLWVDPIRELGLLAATEMSVLMCIQIVRVMACAKINFVCCDSLRGDFRTIDVGTMQSSINKFAGHYAYVVPQVFEAVRNFPHEIITPSGER